MRTIIVLIVWIASAAAPARAEEPPFVHTLKKIFATPTPTPKPRKKKTSTKKKSPTPTPTPSAEAKRSPSPTPSPTPATKKKKPSPTPSASPRRKKRISPTPTPTATPETPVLSEPEGSTSPSPTSTPTPAASPSPTPEASPTESPKRHVASLTPEAIKGFDNYPPKVQQLLTRALELTARDLTYTYGSADPANGGMDCSGFVYYVLNQNGVTDVPRSSSEQYVWLRRAGKFEPVFSRKNDSFEMDNLQPGDLLFWTGTYSIERDPPITHAMIYLGREKKTGERVMVGASDGRIYQGQSQYGVSVFDFKIPRPEKDNGKLRPAFIGYGHIPGLRE